MSEDTKFIKKATIGQRINASLMGSFNTGMKRVWYSFMNSISPTYELNVKLRSGLRHVTLDIKDMKKDPEGYFNSYIKESIDIGDIPKLEGGILRFIEHLKLDAKEEENAGDALIMTIALEQAKIHHLVRSIVSFANKNHEAFKSFSRKDREAFKELLVNLEFIERNMADRMDKLYNLWLSFGRDRMRLRLLGTQLKQSLSLDLQNMNTKMFAGNRMKASSKHAFKVLKQIVDDLNELTYVLESKKGGSAQVLSRSLQDLNSKSLELRKEFETQSELALNTSYNIVQDLFFVIDKVPNAILATLEHLTKDKGLPETERQKISQLLKDNSGFETIISESLKLANEARNTEQQELSDRKDIDRLIPEFV